MFSKKARKIDKIFTVDLTSCSKCQIVGESFVNFFGLLRKHELYQKDISKLTDLQKDVGNALRMCAIWTKNPKTTFTFLCDFHNKFK